MPTVSGVWKWNDVISVIPGKTLNINFTSNSKSFIQMIVERDVAGNVLFYVEDVTTTYVDAYNLYDNTWTNEVYKTIDFGSSEQEVSQDIYTWFTQNATKQEEPVVPTTKTVSSDNLARFKQKCDETYAAIGNIPTVSTELVNLGTLSTSGTLTTDQVTQIGTTTVGVTARASVNSVTRFYERVNISGTTATLVSADDDALHVLTVNLSTRAYTLSDVPLGSGGDSNPTIPTPTTSDNGKVLGVANGAYSLQAAGTIWYHHSIADGAGGYLDFWNTYANPYTSETLSNINTSPRIPVAAKSPDTSGWPNNTIYIAYLEVDSNGELRVYYFDSDHTLQTLAFPWGGDTVTLY